MGERTRYIRMLPGPIADEIESDPDDLYGVDRPAPRFISDQIKAGRIAGIKLGRARYTTPQDIAEWIAKCRIDVPV